MTAISLRDKIVELEDRLKKALEHESWQRAEICNLQQRIINQSNMVETLKDDKHYFKTLCMKLAEHHE